MALDAIVAATASSHTRPGLVLLTGDPGIGKSRLLRYFGDVSPNPRKFRQRPRDSEHKGTAFQKTQQNQRYTAIDAEVLRPAAEAPWTGFPENDAW
jgi:Mg-chelatase subunit ChlI